MKKIDASDVEGRKFNRLTCIKYLGLKDCKRPHSIAIFRCECGEVKEMSVSQVKTGKSKSCGCITRETNKKHMTSHGMSYTPLYVVWNSMKNRCNLESHDSFKYYGGRGISVCPSWSNSFEEFEAWCRENGYRQGLQLDRIDSNGNYEPNNCRFVTPSQNQKNNRNSKYWFVFGVRYDSAKAASNVHGVNYTTIQRWCNGFTKEGKHYPPKDNCWSEKKYI